VWFVTFLSVGNYIGFIAYNSIDMVNMRMESPHRVNGRSISTPQKKRFEANKNETARTLAKVFQKVVNELHEHNPEVAGGTLFGSLARGEGRVDSDIDGFIFVDVKEFIKINGYNSDQLDKVLDYEDSGLLGQNGRKFLLLVGFYQKLVLAMGMEIRLIVW